MQQLIKRFLDEGLTRRGLVQKLSALGIGLTQAQSILEGFQTSEDAGKGLPVPGSTTVKGTGGELLMAQVKAAGSEYVFSNPGSFETGLYDAQLTLVSTRLQRLTSLIDLYRSLGGGWIQRTGDEPRPADTLAAGTPMHASDR